MAKVLVNETSLSGIADAIRAKNGSTDTYMPSEMATAIAAIETGGGGGDLPEEALVITGDCQYRFAYDGWNWFIEEYGDKITTKDMTNLQYMFYNSKALTEVPFDINISSSIGSSNLSYIFAYSSLHSVPLIKGEILTTSLQIRELFNTAKYLREIPYDYFDHFGGETFWQAAKQQNSARNYIFTSCYSLRRYPNLSNLISATTSTSGHLYVGLCKYLYTLDEITNIPISTTTTLTSSVFRDVASYATRLKNFTFATENGAPYVVNWTNQTIDLSSYVGYAKGHSDILNYNSGITEDKFVINDEDYAALKDDPDWYTTDIAWSRYNHDSAVATINSLPDTSAYLATAGGTNTIKFKSSSGAYTIGGSAAPAGAINTLTAEEIAVATAKGWTVTLA